MIVPWGNLFSLLSPRLLTCKMRVRAPNAETVRRVEWKNVQSSCRTGSP